MNLTRTILSSAASNTGGAFVVFLGITYYSRELGASDLGAFFLFQAVLGFATIPASLGLHAAVIKRITEGGNAEAITGTAVSIFAGLSAITIGLIFLVRQPLSEYIGQDLILFLVVGLPLAVFGRLAIALLKAEMRVSLAEFLEFLRRVTWIIVGSLLVVFGMEIQGIAIGLLAGWGIALLTGLWIVNISVGRPSIAMARSLFQFGKFEIVTHLDSYLYNWLDIAIIGVFLAQASVGAYEVAWRIAALTMLGTKAIEKVLLPQVSAWDTASATERIEQLVPRVIFASTFFVIPAVAGAAVIGQDLLGVVFGEEFRTAWVALIILLTGKSVEATDRMLKKLASGLDRPDYHARAVTVSIFLNILLNVTLIPPFGIAGAAVATTTSFLTSTLIVGYYLRQEIELTLPIRKLAWSAASATGMAGLLSLIPFSIQTIPGALSVITAGGVIYLLVCGLSPSIRADAKAIYRGVR